MHRHGIGVHFHWRSTLADDRLIAVSARIHRRLPVLLVGLVAALLSAAPASAVEPQLIGQVGGAGTVGGCTCSLFQRTVAGAPAYTFPYSGILSKVRVFVGEETLPSDSVQARTFRALGPSTASVIGGGEAHSLNGLPLKAPSAFVDRIPATEGDLLGAHYAVNAFVKETPRYFTTASATDALSAGSVTPDPVIGSSFSTSNTGNARVNIEAVLEPDEDGDGYGDASQDLCLGSPIATSACSGSLFGSNLQGERSAPPPGCGGGGCMRIQKKVDGASTAAPFDGVVVRWRVLDGDAGPYRARVVVPNPAASGGAFSGYTVLHSSAAESVTAPVQPLISKISTFQTRLPIPAGAFVGLSVPSLRDQGFQASGGAAVWDEPNDGGDGLTVSGVSHNGTILYDADIEPDADHDGYGDVSQDECPSDASTHGACQPAAASAAADLGAGPEVVTAPSIADFRATPKEFRVKAGGAVVSRRAVHAGTTLRLTLSEAATVTFKLKASPSCSPAKAGRCAKKSPWISTFRRSLHKGANAIPYSGRYARPGQKPKNLKPGAYRMTAIATDLAGKASAPAQTSLVVRP